MTSSSAPDVRPDVLAFLERFAAVGRSADGEAQRELWAETFLSLDPLRAVAVPREAMLAALPRRRELFESIGATTSELVEVEETLLDDQHTIVRSLWRWPLPTANGLESDLRLKSTFLLRRDESNWKIVVYLNHQDVAAVIAERASRSTK